MSRDILNYIFCAHIYGLKGFCVVMFSRSIFIVHRSLNYMLRISLTYLFTIQLNSIKTFAKSHTACAIFILLRRHVLT